MEHKPCPFCGNESTDFPDGLGVGYGEGYRFGDVFVRCGKCGAQGPVVMDTTSGLYGDKYLEAEAADEARAFELWDRRAVPETVDSTVNPSW